MTNIDYKKITSPYVQKYNIAPPIPNNIVFYNDIEGKKVEVLRITKDGIMANPNVPVDEAAEAVIRALDGYIKNLTKRTWVGLDEEDDIDWEEGGNLRDLVEAIEAKLKHKNGYAKEKNI
jgi:hypothetical protein